MPRVETLMVALLCANIVILAPVIAALATGFPFDPVALGPPTPALGVLNSIYAAIAVVSAGLVALHLRRHPWAVPMTVALFVVQITYKFITLFAVGLQNPVVMANLAVMLAQIAVLVMLGQRGITPAGGTSRA